MDKKEKIIKEPLNEKTQVFKGNTSVTGIGQIIRRFKIDELAGVDEDGQLISLDDKEITIKILVKDKEGNGYGYGSTLHAQINECLASCGSAIVGFW